VVFFKTRCTFLLQINPEKLVSSWILAENLIEHKLWEYFEVKCGRGSGLVNRFLSAKTWWPKKCLQWFKIFFKLGIYSKLLYVLIASQRS